MKIIPDIQEQKRLTKRYWRLTRQTFVKCRQAVIDRAVITDPERLKAIVPDILNSKPMEELIVNLWGECGGQIANDIETLLTAKKSGDLNFETKAPKKKGKWDERMKIYAAERSQKKIVKIMSTEVEAINKVIDQVIQTSFDKGLGIIETRKLLTNDLAGEEMLSMENWQAQRIAMTEVGSAQNTASYLAASENSEGVKKQWQFIPGLKTFRENHQQFDAMGPVEMSYEYAPGLKHPGDPDCDDPAEIINCYCSQYWEVD